MDYIKQVHRLYWKDWRFASSLVYGLIILIIGITASYFAIIYATESSSSSVTDIILSNIPVFDVDMIFIYGPVIFFVIVGVYAFLYEPYRVPFGFKSIGIFLLIRSVFISLTHIGPFPTHIHIVSTSIFAVFTTGNDLFFSSHTGLPFLVALVFWDNKIIRYFSILSSIFFGIIVLMAHLHYSIDVFAAFFITYSIFVICQKIYKEDHHVSVNGIQDLKTAE